MTTCVNVHYKTKDWDLGLGANSIWPHNIIFYFFILRQKDGMLFTQMSVHCSFKSILLPPSQLVVPAPH